VEEQGHAAHDASVVAAAASTVATVWALRSSATPRTPLLLPLPLVLPLPLQLPLPLTASSRLLVRGAARPRGSRRRCCHCRCRWRLQR